jgi:hypothetical protein
MSLRPTSIEGVFVIIIASILVLSGATILLTLVVGIVTTVFGS